MTLLLKLVLAHLIGDFLLQPNRWVQEKEERKLKSPKLYLHVMIHGLLVMLLLWDWQQWPIALGIVLAHVVIDSIKLYFQKPKTKNFWLLIDQLLHLISIAWITYLVTGAEIDLRAFFDNPKFLGLITLGIFLTLPAAILLSSILQKWSESIPSQPDQSLQDAGKYIGILERLFVFCFIITMHWEAVGFLLAAKSVFRFGDLSKSKERKLTEYILIGTLLSFGTAIVAGLIFLSI